VVASIEIVRIYISPGHNFFGHHGKPAGKYETLSVPAVECVAGQGLLGDRFFGHKENYKGQVTFFAWEVYEDLCRGFSVHDREPDVFRRNVLTRGLDLNALIGKEFEVQGITFAGMAECSPCHWMNAAFCEGAEKALHGRGGLRARILTDGELRVTI
jgi:MOSC domain-containing protein YiiM